LQQPDRRDGVDGFDLDHPGLPSLQIDGAVNVDALSPAGLLDGELAAGRGTAASMAISMLGAPPVLSRATRFFRRMPIPVTAATTGPLLALLGLKPQDPNLKVHPPLISC